MKKRSGGMQKGERREKEVKWVPEEKGERAKTEKGSRAEG